MSDAKLAYAQADPKASDEEKAILRKWRKSNPETQK